jgi:hypothetical protein
MVEPQETPAGFLLHAREFFDAANAVLMHRNTVSLPSYFLLGRSIELSLKAYLLASGVTQRELKSRKFGHDLSALCKEAMARGIKSKITITDIEIGTLLLLNFDYLEKRLEYRVTGGTYALPHIEVTTQFAQKLANGLDHFCSKA